MKRYIYIGLGGSLGSLARYFISGIPGNKWAGFFLGNTFITNVSGCFALGFFLTMVLEYIEMDSDLRLAISTGFIGSYTTFSTFTNEINSLLVDGELFYALFYLVCSFTAGMLSVWLGTAASRKYFKALPDLESEE